MSRGYRIAGIALGLAISSFSAGAQNIQGPSLEKNPGDQTSQSSKAKGADKTESYKAEAAELLRTLNKIKASLDDLKPEERAAKSAAEIENAERDLKAQEEMAKWAWWMNFATWATAVLAGVGIVSVWWDVLNNRSIGRAQVRAYLSVEPFPAEKIPADCAYEVAFKITNCGQSPAKNCRDCSILILVERNGLESRVDFFERGELPSVGSPISAGTSIYGSAKTRSPLTKDDVSMLVNGKSHVLVMAGIIQYDDIFGEPHEKRFCYALEKTIKPAAGPNGVPLVFNWIVVKPHNQET